MHTPLKTTVSMNPMQPSIRSSHSAVHFAMLYVASTLATARNSRGSLGICFSAVSDHVSPRTTCGKAKSPQMVLITRLAIILFMLLELVALTCKGGRSGAMGAMGEGNIY